MDLSYVVCANKKCGARIGVSDPSVPHFCSVFCGGNLKFTMKQKKVKPKKIYIKKKPVCRKKEFAERRELLIVFKKKSGMNNQSISEVMEVNVATVSSYIIGRYNISDERWNRIKPLLTLEK